MNIEIRQIAVSVLLVFIFGIATVNAHAVTHVSGDATDCKLCSTYSEPPDNIDGVVFELYTSLQTRIECEHPPTWTENGSVQRLFARGPPQND
jgi:hypothetical protein